MTYSYLKALLLNTYVNFIGTYAFKPQHQSKALSFPSPVLDHFPKNAAHSLYALWTPAWPTGSAHVYKALIHIFVVEDAEAWMERYTQTSLTQGSVGTFGLTRWPPL